MSGHACNTHRTYKLTCEQYDALIAHADGSCWRCGVAPERLCVDHDHALGINAVRGMLCDPCNGHLANVDSGALEPDPLDVAYLASAWHVGRVSEYLPDARTPIRTFRVDEELWNVVRATAARRRETVSAVVTRIIFEYVEKYVTDADLTAAQEER